MPTPPEDITTSPLIWTIARSAMARATNERDQTLIESLYELGVWAYTISERARCQPALHHNLEDRLRSLRALADELHDQATAHLWRLSQ